MGSFFGVANLVGAVFLSIGSGYYYMAKKHEKAKTNIVAQNSPFNISEAMEDLSQNHSSEKYKMVCGALKTVTQEFEKPFLAIQPRVPLVKYSAACRPGSNTVRDFGVSNFEQGDFYLVDTR